MSVDLVELAENPALHTPDSPGFERVADPRYCAVFFPGGGRADVQRLRFAEGEVPAGVAELRRLARSRGYPSLLWFVGAAATPADLGEQLLALGLVPDPDAPELTGMVLEAPPAGEPSVEVRPVASYDEFVAASELDWFAWVPQDLAERRAQLPARWRELEERDAARIYVAHLEGEIVGYARAVFGAEAAFLLGGATAPHARGRGVYTSFVHARWRDAVERGTPRLVIQAGAMSAPIVARLGFREVSTIRLYQDDLRD
jgi:hypothetical protein